MPFISRLKQMGQPPIIPPAVAPAPDFNANPDQGMDTGTGMGLGPSLPAIQNMTTNMRPSPLPMMPPGNIPALANQSQNLDMNKWGPAIGGGAALANSMMGPRLAVQPRVPANQGPPVNNQSPVINRPMMRRPMMNMNQPTGIGPSRPPMMNQPGMSVPKKTQY